MLSVRLLQEGQEGLLGSWYQSVGLFWKSPALVGVQCFFTGDSQDLCVWASDWLSLVHWGRWGSFNVKYKNGLV